MAVLPETVETILRSIYFDPKHPASFNGVQKLYKAAKQQNKNILLSDVKLWLRKIDNYTLFKPVRKHFPRGKTIVSVMNEQWQADLMDMQNLAKYNDGFRFLLVVIDILSKRAFVRPLKNKTGHSITEAFKTIFIDENPPARLQTDKGTEFLNNTFQSFLKKHHVHFFTSQDPVVKASLAERLIRTLRSKLFKYFHFTGSYRYLDVLQNLVESYNNSFHSAIGMAPNQVTGLNQNIVYDRLYKQKRKPSYHSPTDTFQIGKQVRISKARRTFEKAYESGWTPEIFTIADVVRKRTPQVFRLKDVSGENILGTFYPWEIQLVEKSDDSFYPIEKILKEKGSRNKKQFLVRWQGYGPQFDSWVSGRDLKHISKT